MSEWTEVARVGDVAPGDLKAVEYDGATIVLFNLDGRYYALDDVCTHDGGPLSDGGVLAEGQVRGACVDARTFRPRRLPAALAARMS